MADNSENSGSGAFETCSSFGGRQDKRPVLPVSTSIHVGPIHFEVGPSIIHNSSENRTVLGGLGDLSPLITGRNNLPYLGGGPEIQFGSDRVEIGTPSHPSLGGLRQNFLGSASLETGSSSDPRIRGTPQNQFDLSGSRVVSSSSQFTGGTPRTYFQMNGFGIESSYGPYVGGSSLGPCASPVGSVNSFYGNSTSIGLSVSGTRPNSFASVGFESSSSLVNTQDDTTDDDWEIYYGSNGIQMGPSRVSQQNNVSIIDDTSENRLGSRGIQLESSSIERQNIHHRRGRPLNFRGQDETGSSVTHSNRGRGPSNRDRGTSGNAWSDRVVIGSATEQPIRMVEEFSGEDQLHYKMAKIEDWTKEEITIVEEALKVPSSHDSKEAWFASVSDLLHNKTARDVSIFLNCSMKVRNAKRIKVDPKITTENDRKENVPNSSPSSSHLAGSSGPRAQGTAVSNQEFPPVLTLQGTTNAAPTQLRTTGEVGYSVSSPTSDLDINLLLSTPYSPERINEDLFHLLPPPEPNPDEAKDHNGTSGQDTRET